MEQEANYKVNIDTADLQSQLANIRTMLDQTFQAQMLTADVPNPQPQAFAFPSQGFDNAIGVASQDISSIHAGTSNALSSMNMGMQKFRESTLDALMSPGPSLGGPIPSDRYIPDFKQSGAWGSLGAATFGFGYDPRMSITRGGYKEKASEQFGHEALGLGLDLGFGGVGAMLGKLGGSAAVGGIVGVAAGMLAKPVLDATLLYDYNTANDIKSYSRDTSWRFLSGKFSNEEASKVGIELSTVQRSKSMVGDRVGASDVQRLLGEYTEAGAFDYVRSAEEYVGKAKGLIENHRKVMQILRVSEQEAVAAWASASTVGQAAAIQGMAYNAGMTSSELMQWGNQGMEMVRGTGIDLTSAKQGAYQTITDVTSMVASGNISTALAQQLGGVQGIAGYMQQVGYQWGNSSQGFAQLTAAGAYNGNFGAWANASPYDTVGAAIGQNRTLGEFLENKGGMAATLSQMSPEVMYGMQGLQFLKEMQFVTGNGQLIGGLNENKFVGWMGQKYGMSDPQSRLMWSTLTSDDDPTMTVLAQRAEATKNIIDAAPGLVDYTLDTLGNAFGSVSSIFTKPAMHVATTLDYAVSSMNKNMKEYLAGDTYGINIVSAKNIIKSLKLSKEELKQGEIDAAAIKNAAKTSASDEEKKNSKEAQKDLAAATVAQMDESAAEKSIDFAKNIGDYDTYKKSGGTFSRDVFEGIKDENFDTRTKELRETRGKKDLENIAEGRATALRDIRKQEADREKVLERRVVQNLLKDIGGNDADFFSIGQKEWFGSSLTQEEEIRRLEILGKATLIKDEGVRQQYVMDNLGITAENAQKTLSSGFDKKLRKAAATTAALAFTKTSADRDIQEGLDKQFSSDLTASEQLGTIKQSAQNIMKSMGVAEGALDNKFNSGDSKATLAIEMMNSQSLKTIAEKLGSVINGSAMLVRMTR